MFFLYLTPLTMLLAHKTAEQGTNKDGKLKPACVKIEPSMEKYHENGLKISCDKTYLPHVTHHVYANILALHVLA